MTAVVREWPAYLLVGIPDHLQEKVTAEAEAQNRSLNDVVRGHLCAHYRMRCSDRGQGFRKPSGGRLMLRLQPRLWERIKGDASGYGEIKALIVDVLERHYAKEEK